MNNNKELTKDQFRDLTNLIGSRANNKAEAWDLFLHVQDLYNDREMSYKQYDIIIKYLLQIMRD